MYVKIDFVEHCLLKEHLHIFYIEIVSNSLRITQMKYLSIRLH